MRRLPVIQQAASEDDAAAARPRWHWCLIGAGLAATIWVPLATVATPLGASLAARSIGAAPEDIASGAVALTPRLSAIVATVSALPLIVCFGVAALLAGALVGRFGGRAGKKEAGIAGAIAAFLVISLAALAGAGLGAAGFAAATLALATVGAACGFAGGAFGARRRSVLGSTR